MLHRFTYDISGIELPERFNNPFYYSPHQLCLIAADEVRGMLSRNELLAAEAAKGKMFGVLVVRDGAGALGYLAAFSGLLAGCNRVPEFVPPVFDFLSPVGYFKREEENISAINARINDIRKSEIYRNALDDVARTKESAAETLDALAAEYAANKEVRRCRRGAGGLTIEEELAMTRQSQFEKAELKRRRKAWMSVIAEKEARLADLEEKVSLLSNERKSRSLALQRWLFEQFKVLNACGEERCLLDIFTENVGCLPPAGAGECAAPKLLQYAFINGLEPLCMAEFWLGCSPAGEVRRDGCFYGSCKSKCEPILSYMLQGLDVEENAIERGGDIGSLEVLYEDDSIIAVNKPSGVLSVPGLVGGMSVQQWLRDTKRSNDIYVVHRLDMATSGVLVVAKTMDMYKEMQRLFASREVRKEYIALLESVPSRGEGMIELPISPDYENRPRQKVDSACGKEAVTRYKVLETVERDGRLCAKVLFEPLTGRTHQLRVHAAHKCGLDTPIVGDALYGKVADRLMLHAASLEFVHPLSGEIVKITANVPF